MLLILFTHKFKSPLGLDFLTGKVPEATDEYVDKNILTCHVLCGQCLLFYMVEVVKRLETCGHMVRDNIQIVCGIQAITERC